MKNKMSRKKVIIITIIAVIVVIASLCVGAYFHIQGKIYVPGDENVDIGDKEKIDLTEEKGIINILLIGIDARGKDEDARTDSIIMATIDSNSKKIKLTSFMRDLYVPIEGHGQNRINAAYFFGGPELLLKTLNTVFHANVQYYMQVDFKAFQDVVDKLGGADIEVKKYEVNEINKCITEVNPNNPEYIKEEGLQHLNGQQALAYCRIRHVGNSDYERTERQRRVLSVLIDKMRNINITKIPDIINTTLSYIKTNIPVTKLINIAYTAYKFGNTSVGSMRIPVTGAFDSKSVYGQDVLVPDVRKNCTALDNYIYSNGGGILASSIPIYMQNTYHTKDVALDRRGIEREYVEIKLPKEPVKPPEEVKENPGENPKDNPGENPKDNPGENPGENPGDNPGETASP